MLDFDWLKSCMIPGIGLYLFLGLILSLSLEMLYFKYWLEATLLKVLFESPADLFLVADFSGLIGPTTL